MRIRPFFLSRLMGHTHGERGRKDRDISLMKNETKNKNANSNYLSSCFRSFSAFTLSWNVRAGVYFLRYQEHSN